MSEAINSSLKTVAKGTALVFSGMAVSQALWFVIKILLAGNLSREDFGIYSLIIAIAAMVSLVANMGLCEGSTRYISILLGQGRQEDSDRVQRSSLMIGTITSAASCAAIILLAGVLSRHVFYKPELFVPLMVISLFIPADVLASILAAILRGRGIISPKVYFLDIGQPLFFLILISPVFLFGFPFISIIWAYVFSMMMVSVLMAVSGHRNAGINPFSALSRGTGGYAGELMRFSIPVLSMQGMSLILRSADTLMLGRYDSAEQVGIYSIGVSLAALLSLPPIALGFAYMPIAGELYAKNRASDLAKTYQVLTRWIFAATLPIFFILFFFPEMTITFLFGDKFLDSAHPLRILSLGYLIYAFMGSNSMMLLVMGRSKEVMKVSAAGAMLNVLLNYILIKHVGLGLYGAALSSMVSFIVISGGYSFVLYRHNRMHPIASGYLKPVIGSALIGIVIYAAAKSLPLYFWMLPLYFLLYVCGYIASLFLTRSVHNEDIFLFREIMNTAGVAPDITEKIIRKISYANVENINKE
jgi:O-antigen/teichoic acid export membrane protein